MPRPLPPVNADSKPYWDAAHAGKLVYQRCAKCGHAQFPPRRMCVACHATSLEWQPSSGQGRVHTFTVVSRAPTEAFKDSVPYVIALVDLAEGFRIMVNVVGDEPARLAIGDPVRIVFEAISPEISLPQAERV